MPQGRQLGFAAVIMLMLAALMIGAWLFLRAPYEPLFTHLRTADAATIVDELDHRKTPYLLADSGTTILVPASRVDATRLALMNGNLALKGTVGFELFNKSDMGLTDFAQRINYQRALQGELERTIMALDGVEESRVHLSLGENRIFREDRVAPKASVMIRMRTGATLRAEAAAGIQRLVAASVPQLEATDVVILDETGQVIGASPSVQAVPAPPAAAEQAAIGSYYEARIREALEQNDLADKVRVQVHAGLAPRSGTGARADWHPGARDFPLQVALDAQRSIDTEARQDILRIAAAAVGFDASLGDAINIGTVATPTTLSDAPPVATRPAADRSFGSKTNPLTRNLPLLVWPGLVAVILAGALLLIGRRQRGGRPLSNAERARAAARLRALLNEEELDGALS